MIQVMLPFSVFLIIPLFPLIFPCDNSLINLCFAPINHMFIKAFPTKYTKINFFIYVSHYMTDNFKKGTPLVLKKCSVYYILLFIKVWPAPILSILGCWLIILSFCIYFVSILYAENVEKWSSWYFGTLNSIKNIFQPYCNRRSQLAMLLSVLSRNFLIICWRKVFRP